MNRLILIAAAAALLLSAPATPASSQVVIAPLFEYPVAPDELVSLEDKSNYLVEHFWDALDVKSTGVAQAALDDAFSVYTAAIRFADRDKALDSIDRLLKSIRKNPALLIQMTKAAEDNLYGARAQVISDEAYLPFLRAVTSSKKVPAIRKARWKSQLSQLEVSQPGMTLPAFPIEDRTGAKGEFSPRARYTIIEFGDPSCDDCRFSRLTLDTNPDLTRLVDREQIQIAFIVATPEEGWKEEVASYPPKWLVASAEGIDDILDIRSSPTFYVIDASGKIMGKNMSAEQAARLVISSIDKEEATD